MTRYGGIRLGDSHTGGGVMVEASGFPVGGKNQCRIGDQAFCPTHNGSFPLVSGGNADFMVMGRMAVFEPAKLACGCTVISSCREFFARVDEGGAGALAGAIAGVAASAASGVAAFGAQALSQESPHDEQFQLLSRNGNPLVNAAYKIVFGSGAVVAGTTDAEGKTFRVVTQASEPLHIYLVR